MANTLNLISASTPLFLLIACLSPFLLLGILANPRWRQYALMLAPWSALPAFLLALSLNTGTTFTLKWVLLGIHLGIDPLSQVFLGFTAFLWLLTGFFIHGYMQYDSHVLRFFLFYLLSMGGNISVILAQDAGSFYLFFTVMNLATYGFIVHGRNDYTYHAGWLYLAFIFVSEITLLAALLLAVHANNGDVTLATLTVAIANAPQRHLIIGLLVIAFGSKIGLLGLHVSLPIACHAIPVAGAVVFGGAMLNVGLLGWLRFLPLGESALPFWDNGFIIWGLMTVFGTTLLSLFQESTRALLAYACMSQMGMVTVLLGIALADPHIWPLLQIVVWLYIIHYALTTGSLFLGTGVINATPNDWSRFLTWLGLLLPALAVAGAPWTAGAVVRHLINMHSYLAPTFWPHYLGGLLTAATFMTTLLMGRFLWLAWYQEKPPVIPRCHIGLWLPWFFSLGAVVWIAVRYYAEYEDVLMTMAGWQLDNPVIGGILVVLLAFYVTGVEGMRISWQIREGDMLWPLWTRSQHKWHQIQIMSAEVFLGLRLAIMTLKQHWKHNLSLQSAKLQHSEVLLSSWYSVGLVLLLLITSLLVLLASA